jgi:3'-5' exoribonuclease
MTTINSTDEEQIRKIYINTLKSGDVLQTVFKATKKERLASRAGKPYLAVNLVDRTGELECRVFDNVEAADASFAVGDYLLVKGKIGAFHGKLQIVVERMERLDAGPIDAAEFDYTAPPKAEVKDKAPAEKHEPREEGAQLKLPKRLHKLLQNRDMARAVDELLIQVEHYIDARIAEKLGHAPAAVKPEKTYGEKRNRDRGPKVDMRPHFESKHLVPVPEEAVKRDANLPSGLAFKPLAALVTDESKS